METRGCVKPVREDLDLGVPLEKFKGSRELTYGDVLSVHEHFLRLGKSKKCSNEDAASDTAEELLTNSVWASHGIPAMKKESIIKKIVNFRKEFNTFKSIPKARKNWTTKKDDFKAKLTPMFDISAGNAEEKIMTDRSLDKEAKEEDLAYLAHKRQGLPASCTTVKDTKQQESREKMAAREAAEKKRIEKEAFKKEASKKEAFKTVSSETIDIDEPPSKKQREDDLADQLFGQMSDSEDEATDDDDGDDSDFDGSGTREEREKRRKKPKKFTLTFTQRDWIKALTPALDRYQISSRGLFFLLQLLVMVGGGSLAQVDLSHSLIHELRKEADEEIAAKIQADFEAPKFFAASYDGKQRENWKQNAEHISVNIQGEGMEKEKHLGDEKTNGTGEGVGWSVFCLLFQWNIWKCCIAFNFDTCSVNTGIREGANVLLEKLLGGPRLWWACMHHILEICGAVIKVKLGPTSGPTDKIFGQFQKWWSDLSDKDKDDMEKEALNRAKNLDDEGDPNLKNMKEDSTNFFTEFWSSDTKFHHGDNLEYVRLVMFFLGNAPCVAWSRFLGAVHHARWLAMIIYILKMYIAGLLFSTQSEAKKIWDFTYFFVYLYARYWFACSILVDCPFLTLSLWNALRKWETRDPELAKAALNKLKNHTWYLTERNMIICLWSKKVGDDEKALIAKALKDIRKPILEGKPALPSISETSSLKDFVSEESYLLFDLTGIEPTFLDKDVKDWEKDITYVRIGSILAGMRSVNDVAERGVKLSGEYCNVLTKDDAQRQSIMQVAEQHRTNFPKATKKACLKQ